MSAVRRLFIQLLKKLPAAGTAADGSRLYLYVTETGALSYQGGSLEGWRRRWVGRLHQMGGTKADRSKVRATPLGRADSLNGRSYPSRRQKFACPSLSVTWFVDVGLPGRRLRAL